MYLPKIIKIVFSLIKINGAVFLTHMGSVPVITAKMDIIEYVAYQRMLFLRIPFVHASS